MKPPNRLLATTALTLALSALSTPAAPAQGIIPPPRPGLNAGPPQGDINRLSHEMAERVRRLGEDIASDLGRTPQGRHLQHDLRELAVSVDEFHESLHNTRNPFRIKQAYTGIDETWHHLKWQLGQPGVASPAVARAARRVDETDAALHQALDLREYTPTYGPPHGGPPPVAGPPPVSPEFLEIQRLAVALDQRAQALAATVQAEMSSVPGAPRLTRGAARLAQLCDAFADGLRPGQPFPAVVAAFGPAAESAERLEVDLRAYKLPPPVSTSWQSFAAAEVLIRQRLGLPVPPPTVAVVLKPAKFVPPPFLAMADQLNAQTDAFLGAFAPNYRNVPEGDRILADAQRMKAAAVAFREECGRGLDPVRLAQQYEGVEQMWDRLARRINRIAQGRTGPTIQIAAQMGETCGKIHQLLAMPGYSPVIGANVPPGP